MPFKLVHIAKDQ